MLSISFIFSLIGILVVLLVSFVSSPKLYSISDLDKNDIDQVVRVRGNIESFHETPGLYLINLADDSGKITVVVFKNDEMDLTEGMFVEVIGSVVEYGDQIEITAKEIVL